MKTILTVVLASTLLADLSTFAAAQEAPAQAQSTQQLPDGQGFDGGDQGGEGWGMHGGHHGGRHGGKHGGQHGKGGPGMMMNLDANGDGVISESEAAMGASFGFSHMDRNGDDAISETEFTTMRKHGSGWFGTQTAEDAAVLKLRTEKFAKLDTDKNKLVDKVEFMSDFKNRFMAADADKDGKVTVWEFEMQK